MHRTLCGWEYYVLLKEAQTLLKNRMSKAYQISDKLFRLDFSKFSLIICIGEYFYVTQSPPQSPQNPTSFAMTLRKHVGSKFLDSFKQYQNDRIYILEFSNNYKIVIEQFSKGNMFLLDDTGKIIRPYSFKPSEKKSYAIGQEYSFEKSPPLYLLQNLEEFNLFKKENSQKSISSALGKLSFGKIYTNDILDSLKIERNTLIDDINDQQAQDIISCLSQMQKSAQPLICKREGVYELSLRPLQGWDIVQRFDSFSSAIEKFIQSGFDSSSKQNNQKNPQIIRMQIRLVEQQNAILKLDKELNELEIVAKNVQTDIDKIQLLLDKAKKEGKKSLIISDL